MPNGNIGNFYTSASDLARIGMNNRHKISDHQDQKVNDNISLQQIKVRGCRSLEHPRMVKGIQLNDFDSISNS